MEMPDKRKLKKAERYFRCLLLVTACLLGVGLAGVLRQGGSLPSVRLSPAEYQTMEDGWYQMVDGVKQPLDGMYAAGQPGSEREAVIYHELPKVTSEDAMMFSNNYQGVAVYIGDECIYDYGIATKAAMGSMLGDAICMVPMKEEYSGQTVGIHIVQPMSGKLLDMGFAKMYLDHRNSLVLNVIRHNEDQMFCALLFTFISLALLSVYLMQWMKKRAYERRNILYLGILILLAAIWILTDSALPQVLWSNATVFCVISFFVFMLLPVPALGLLGTICSGGKVLLRILEDAALLNIAVQSALYILGIFDYPMMLPVTHLLMVADFAVGIYLLMNEAKKTGDRYAKGVLVALGILLVCSLINMVAFYRISSGDNSRFFRYGFVAFILILFFFSLNDLIQFTEEKTEIKLYKKLAYTDLMTRLKNRAAYERYIEGLKAKESENGSLTFVMMDVNNLKPVNDNYGHGAGDVILKGAAECIRKIFGGTGQIFRIGGDEFFVAVDRNDLNMGELTERLLGSVEDFNVTSEYPLSLACGYADNRGDETMSISRLLKAADDKMYENKLAHKKARWNSYSL